MTTKPERGQIVDYTLTSENAETINRRRDVFRRFRTSSAYNTPVREITGTPTTVPELVTLGRLGFQAHVGQQVKAGDIYPAMVMAAHSPASLLVFPDGTDTLWISSAAEGDREGQWRFPLE